MIENLPSWIEIIFLVTCAITIGLYYFSNANSKNIIVLIILWSILHALLAYNGFYLTTNSIPPSFALFLLPATLFIIYGLLPRQMAGIMKNRNTKTSIFLHTVRIPVEIVLYYLFLNKMVPELMTFAGRNFDILIGISAPIIGILYLKNVLGKKGLIIWNVIGLCFVLFILINGLFSAEVPFQQFGFEQPNRAISYFPFVLLPATVVPLVIYTHLSDILILRNELKNEIK